MADRISCGWDFLARVFQEILGIVCHEDGVSFDAGSIKIEPITVEKKYFLARVFQEILGIVCHEDGVSFDAGSIKIEPITVEKKYPGTRFYFTAHLADRTRRL